MAKLSKEVERKTKECNTLIRQNEEIKIKINEHRLIVVTTKRAITTNSKQLLHLQNSIQKMLESNHLFTTNEKLQRKIEKMMKKEETEEKNTENEILRLTERLRHVRRPLFVIAPHLYIFIYCLYDSLVPTVC